MVDKLLMGRKLADLDTYLHQVKEFSKISAPAYDRDWKTQRIIERTLQIPHKNLGDFEKYKNAIIKYLATG